MASIRKTKKLLKKTPLFEVYFKGNRFNLITQFDHCTFHKQEMDVFFSCNQTILRIPFRRMGAVVVYKIEN